MPDYFVFGGCLRSELRFPELTETHGRTPDWTLRVGKLSPREDGELLSNQELSSTCRIRLTRGDGWLRYAHSCTGTFEVYAERRRILFEPSPECDLNGARTDFVARVLLHCVDHAAVTWLHGSSVRIGESAIAFLGPSGAGKSTLALALARAGAEHICDDTLPIEAGARPTVWPSDHVIRLQPDSRRWLASRASAVRRESDGKFVLTQDAVRRGDKAMLAGERRGERSPLSALYLLNPGAMAESPCESTHPASRRLIPPRVALTALMQHVKLGPVVRPEDPPQIMQQLGDIARSVPIFNLRVTRDWTIVDRVVAQIMAWHVEAGADETPTLSTPLSIPA